EISEPSDLAFARRLLREGPSASDLEGLEGRTFPSLLWPLRGGEASRRRGQRLEIRGSAGDAIRAASDGRVIYVGEGLRGRGVAIVLLHPNGWITTYRGPIEPSVDAGAEVLRGHWLGRLTELARGPSLRFEMREGSRPRDPSPLLVQVPEALRRRLR
ncbi:MAG: M23 family metallopeptidase, partial [Myxococcales bacterium]|nr:M23 family metallopeptidase [Myxococcales bacterium]